MVWELGEEEQQRENSQDRETNVSVGSQKKLNTLSSVL